MRLPTAILPLLLLAPLAAQGVPAATEGVGIEEHLGAQLPLDLRFRTAAGQPVRLGDALRGDRPTVLVLAYYHCEMLCSLVLRGAAASMAAEGGFGTRYRALTVSIDPRDTPADARVAQAAALAALGRTGAAADWPFLVGDAAASRALARGVGFQYRWDPATEQFAHPAAIFVLTPGGQVSRYLYGVQYPPERLGVAVQEAAEGRSGSSWDHFLTLCYHYVPALRRYGGLVSGMLRGGAALVLLAFGAGVWLLIRRVRREETA